MTNVYLIVVSEVCECAVSKDKYKMCSYSTVNMNNLAVVIIGNSSLFSLKTKTCIKRPVSDHTFVHKSFSIAL